MNAIWRIVLILMLVSVFGNDTALGQGTKGENQFRQQIQNAWKTAGPAMQQARDALAQARAQGINTSAADAALNRAQYLFDHPELWYQQRGNFVSQGMGPKLKTINPFGDFLFHDAYGPDGKLVTRNFDPNVLAARTEEWAKQLKAVNEQMKSLPEAQKASFVAEKNAALKSSGLDYLSAPELGEMAGQSPGDEAIRWLDSMRGVRVKTSITPAAGNLVSILNKAAQVTNPTRSIDPDEIALKCQDFFKQVGGVARR